MAAVVQPVVRPTLCNCSPTKYGKDGSAVILNLDVWSTVRMRFAVELERIVGARVLPMIPGSQVTPFLYWAKMLSLYRHAYPGGYGAGHGKPCGSTVSVALSSGIRFTVLQLTRTSLSRMEDQWSTSTLAITGGA